jgi:hypothetical protein
MGKFLTTPIGSALRVLVGVVLGYLVLDLSADKTISVGLDEVTTWIAAGLVVAVPILIAAVNPADTRFGKVGPSE